MQIVTCTYEQHAAAILDILNDAIVNSTALYDYQPRNFGSMLDWFKAKDKRHFAIIGAVDATGQILGFTTYGLFRTWPAYKYSIEHSVYIHKDHRGKGLGYTLLQNVIEAAKEQDYHVLIGGIDADNVVSISLHKKLGFTHAGTIQQAGFKFGRWLDLAFYQLILAVPKSPVDG